MFKYAVKSHSRDFSKELCFTEAMNNIFKCFSSNLVPGPLEDILNDPKIEGNDIAFYHQKLDQTETSDFWVLAATLKLYFDKEKTLPVAGTVPDMTATTDLYLDVQKL